jgi:hypothetical protein
MSARRIFAVIAALAAMAIAGCGSLGALFENPSFCVDRGDGLCWFANPLQIPLKTYEWEVDDASRVSARCNYEERQFGQVSCVMGRIRETGTCWVVSALTEQEAKETQNNSPLMKFEWPKRSIFQHEVEDHCGLIPDGKGGFRQETQWLHTNSTVRLLTDRR